MVLQNWKKKVWAEVNTEVNCHVVLSRKVHTNDALAVKITEMLVCYNIDVLESTSIAKLFPLR